MAELLKKDLIVVSAAKVAIDRFFTQIGEDFFYKFLKDGITFMNSGALEEMTEVERKNFLDSIESSLYSLVLGGSIANTARSIESVMGAEFVMKFLPYAIDCIENKEIRKLLQGDCSKAKCVFLKDNPEEGGSPRYSQIDIAEGDGKAGSKVGERYMYNPQEVFFPTLTVEEWAKEFEKIPGNKLPMLLFEGYTMHGNINTFMNASVAAKEKKIPVCISLSAEFVVNTMHEYLLKMIDNGLVSEIYGNECEIECLIRKPGIEKSENDLETLDEIDKLRDELKALKTPKEKLETEEKIKNEQLKLFKSVLPSIKNVRIFATRGGESTLLFENGLKAEVPVQKLKGKQLVNTLGAGDAWLAGYLSGKILKLSDDKSIQMGHVFAANVLMNKSASLEPNQVSFLKDFIKQRDINYYKSPEMVHCSTGALEAIIQSVASVVKNEDFFTKVEIQKNLDLSKEKKQIIFY